MNIYGEFTSKVQSASKERTVARFVERLCAKNEIRSLRGDEQNRRQILHIMKDNDPEVLNILREETQLVILMMREVIDEKKQSNKNSEFTIDDHITIQMEGKEDGLF